MVSTQADQEEAVAHANTILGKHARNADDEDEVERDGRSKNVDRNPFLSEDGETEQLEEEDPMHLAEALSHHPMNIVFEVEDYEFTAKVDNLVFGEQFTAYYTDCQSLSYDADNLSDFVALSGVLFLEDRPTSLQKKHFGDIYEQLRDYIDRRVKYPTPEEVMDAVRLCRDAKDAYNGLPFPGMV
ncbi:hypothetical protein BGZ73_002603 [Actinomortierella ambigua]|nr:hypothetical protein BGZ73_002603 [Actinomortierella ambigua]